MNFIKITKNYFNYRKKYDLQEMHSWSYRDYLPSIKKMFDEIEGFVQKECKCTDDELALIRRARYDESSFFKFIYTYFQRYLNNFENIRTELEELNKEFYELGKIKKEEIVIAYETKSISEIVKMKNDWFELKYKYYEVYSLLFLNEIVTDEFKLAFLRKGLELVKNNEFIKFADFYKLVTSKSFMENKISNALLEKTLYPDNVDKFFGDEAVAGRIDYAKPIIWDLLTSDAYYNGKITEDSLNILFDEKYRVIKIMIALLPLSEDYYTRDNKKFSKKIEEKHSYIDLIIDLLNYPKKEELCEMFESSIIPLSSRIIYIPAYESQEDISSYNATVINAHYNYATEQFDPEGDVNILFMIEDEELVPRISFSYPQLKYNPIDRLAKNIKEWLCTERVLPFTTRFLRKTLQSKN